MKRIICKVLMCIGFLVLLPVLLAVPQIVADSEPDAKAGGKRR